MRLYLYCMNFYTVSLLKDLLILPRMTIIGAKISGYAIKKIIDEYFEEIIKAKPTGKRCYAKSGSLYGGLLNSNCLVIINYNCITDPCFLSYKGCHQCEV